MTSECHQEEEEDDDDDEGRPAGVYRRLIFLANEGVVQTEVRRRNGKIELHAKCHRDQSSGLHSEGQLRGVLNGGGGVEARARVGASNEAFLGREERGLREQSGICVWSF